MFRSTASFENLGSKRVMPLKKIRDDGDRSFVMSASNVQYGPVVLHMFDTAFVLFQNLTM